MAGSEIIGEGFSIVTYITSVLNCARRTILNCAIDFAYFLFLCILYTSNYLISNIFYSRFSLNYKFTGQVLATMQGKRKLRLQCKEVLAVEILVAAVR